MNNYSHQTPPGVETPSNPYGGSAPEETQKSENGSKKTCLFGMSCVGCGALGCLGVIILFIGLFVAGVSWINNKLLADKPADLPPIYLNEKEEKLVEGKMAAFRTRLNKSGKTATVSLSPKELNYWLQKNSDKNNASINLSPQDDGSIGFMLSGKVEGQEGPPKYVNITGKGRIEIVDEFLKVNLDKMQLGKQDISNKDILKGISRNFTGHLGNYAEYKQLPIRIINFKFEDGKFSITMKPRDHAGTLPSEESTPSDEDSSKEEPMKVDQVIE